MSVEDELSLYAAAGVHEWLSKEPAGQWCSDQSFELDYTTCITENYYALTVTVFAEMSEQEHTLFRLKFG